MSNEATNVTAANDEPSNVTDQVRDKIKSKMDVAKFFTGFITLLIGFLLKDESKITPAFKTGFILLIASLSFGIAAMFTYDDLLWPKEHIEHENNDTKILNSDFRMHLENKMVWLWVTLFIPAVGCFGLAFFFLVRQKLGLGSLVEYQDDVWKLALVLAFLLPILICFLMWPRWGKLLQQMSPTDFPKRLPQKLKAIRERLRLTPDEIAPKVGAKTGAEILAYENDEDDLLVMVLWNYSKLAGCPIDQLLNDNLEVTFRDSSLFNKSLRML